MEARVLPKAPEQAPARLREALRRAVLKVDAEAAEKRRQDKLARRMVREFPTGDGCGALEIHGDAIRTQAAYQRVRAIAKKLPADGRTLDQRCSDVALDLLAGKDFDQVQVHVQLTVPATTLLGVDATAQTALELAAQQDATWRRILHDPASGQVVDVGRRRYCPAGSVVGSVKASTRTRLHPPRPQLRPGSCESPGSNCRHWSGLMEG